MEDYEAKAIRVWMRTTMDTKQWSANHWGKIAKTSPTNITRFLNGSKFVPSSKTIAKLASVAGTSPDLGGNNAIALRTQTVNIFRDGERVDEMTVFNVKGELEAHIWPRECGTNGIAQGDIVVVRKQKQFDEGNLICFHDDEIRTGIKVGGQNAAFQPRKGKMVMLKDVKVKGKVVQIIKQLDC